MFNLSHSPRFVFNIIESSPVQMKLFPSSQSGFYCCPCKSIGLTKTEQPIPSMMKIETTTRLQVRLKES